MKKLSILLVSFLVGCAPAIPEFPKSITHIYEIDTGNTDSSEDDVCAKYEIISFRPFKVKWIKDVSIVECNSHTSIPTGQFQDILLWKKSVEDWYATVRCKSKK